MITLLLILRSGALPPMISFRALMNLQSRIPPRNGKRHLSSNPVNCRFCRPVSIRPGDFIPGEGGSEKLFFLNSNEQQSKISMVQIVNYNMTSISKKIEQEVLSLPVRDRIELIDRLIDSLNLPGDPEIDRLWADEAERRYSDLETGSVTPIPGNKIFSNIKTAFPQ